MKAIVLMVGLVLCILSSPRAAEPPLQDWNDVFRSRSIALHGSVTIPKWRRVMIQHERDKAIRRPDCNFGNSSACVLADWDKFIEGIKRLPTGEMIREVNAHMNKHKYIRDIVTWGVEDYWETPLEFLSVNGDCEDFAIAKFYSLRRLGIPNKDMKIVVVYDRILSTEHAVLAVRHDGDYLILDNLVPVPVPEFMIFHYRTIYSVNESGTRIHEAIR